MQQRDDTPPLALQLLFDHAHPDPKIGKAD
jgi:hypothetical protein